MCASAFAQNVVHKYNAYRICKHAQKWKRRKKSILHVDKGNNKFPTHGVYLCMYYITQCNEDEFNNKVSKAPTPRQLTHTNTQATVKKY